MNYPVASIRVNQAESLGDDHTVLLRLERNHRWKGLDQRESYPATLGTHNVGTRYLPTFTILAFSRRFIGDDIESTTPSSSNDPCRLSASHHFSAISCTYDANHPPNGYPCTTEDNGTSSLAFNTTRNGSIPVIHRFEPGSTLFYFIDQRYLSPRSFCLLRVAMHTAASSWNLCKMGVTFQEVLYANEAVFRVVYDPYLSSEYYATAFFPSAYDKTLAVGPLSFQRENVDFLSNVLCHELGHVLGVRHTKWETTERGPAFYFPTRALDEASVMNSALAHTLALLVISKKDAEEVRQLYSLAEGLHGRGAPCGEFHIRDVCVKRPWDVWRLW
jgi:hypothetical protein